jgi:hypothetical protein
MHVPIPAARLEMSVNVDEAGEEIKGEVEMTIANERRLVNAGSLVPDQTLRAMGLSSQSSLNGTIPYPVTTLES